MEQSEREKHLNKLLLWEMLGVSPEDVNTVTAGHYLKLNDGRFHHVTRGGYGELVTTPAFTAPDDMGDWLVIHISADSKYLEQFGKSAAYKHKALQDIFTNSNLQQGSDYELIMAYRDKSVEGKKFWQLHTPPDNFVVAINASSFEHLAAHMLHTLADPEKGMALAGFKRKDRYLHSFKYPDVPITRAVMYLMVNAKIHPKILEKIKAEAVAHDNFDYVRVLEGKMAGTHAERITNKHESGGIYPGDI
ncbi:MAG: hypothetical protein ACK502_08930 [Alphaproteobacteria bacterium]